MPSCLAIWAFGRPSTAASRTASSLNSRVYSLRGLRSMEHPLAENYPPLDVSTERGHDHVRGRASGIGAEVRLTAAPGIAVARGWMPITSYVPDAAFQ